MAIAGKDRTMNPHFNRVAAFLLIALSLFVPLRILAGPNSGGTLIVHDTGYWYTWESISYPNPPPSDCASVDNVLPTYIPNPPYGGCVWKVYAAFPTASSPRLKALAFSESFYAPTYVVAGGLPDPVHDFEITQNGWPVTDGGAAGISFGTVKTDLISEIYWFAGYTYEEAVGYWSTAPHPVSTSIFVDDSIPPQEDPIAGFSSIGFGAPGNTICPSGPGSCCFSDGSCLVLLPEECGEAGGSFGLASSCDPNPCPPVGACCLSDGSCQVLAQHECLNQGGLFQGGFVPCVPDPCPPGACCYPDGGCMILEESVCVGQGGDYMGYGSDCEPNPCPQPVWVCCLPDGSCLLRTQADCEQNYGGHSIPGLQDCLPNPCEQVDGACCMPDATCVIATLVECAGLGGQWLWPYVTCEPNPCPTTPVIETTWGRIKNRFQ
jgi:hypothetical protein